jgi:hypothetical protein
MLMSVCVCVTPPLTHTFLSSACCLRLCPSLYFWFSVQSILHVAVGWNTSTVALRVVEGDEREPGAWGYNWVITLDSWNAMQCNVI